MLLLYLRFISFGLTTTNRSFYLEQTHVYGCRRVCGVVKQVQKTTSFIICKSNCTSRGGYIQVAKEGTG